MTNEDAKPFVVVLVADLFFVSRIEDVLNRLGYGYAVWQGGDDLEAIQDLVLAKKPDLLVLDLNNRDLDWRKWLPGFVADRVDGIPSVLAFGAHMDVEAMQLAKQVGVDQVLSKSRFTSAMPELIRAAVEG